MCVCVYVCTYLCVYTCVCVPATQHCINISLQKNRTVISILTESRSMIST